MTEAPLTVDRRGPFQVWTMAGAPVNAINDEMIASLERAIQDASADEAVAAVTLASSLKVFSAGADAKWMAATVAEVGVTELLEMFNRSMDRFRDVCRSMRAAPFLVVAAIDGSALAGGLELAAACDLRFSSTAEGIQIGVPEMNLFGALPSGGGGVQYLTRLMGPARALQFILDGRPVNGPKAYEAGIVERLCDPGEATSEAIEFCSDVARKAGRVGISAAKRSVFGGAGLSLGDALDLDRSVHWDAMRRGNFKAGVESFVSRFG